MTSHLCPIGPPLPGPWAAWEEQAWAAALCRAQNAGRGGSPPPSGSATLTALPDSKMSQVQCRLPSFAESNLPCAASLSGLSRQGVGHAGKASGLPVASPNTLGDQIYLMVKGLVPDLAARASGLAPPPGPGPGPKGSLSAPLTQYSSEPATCTDVFERKKKGLLFSPSCNK